MTLKTTLMAAVAAAALAMPAFADGMMIKDSYARAAGMSASAGAAFIVIENHTGEDDRLIGASSEIAKRVELHTHIEDANGVMKMTHVEEGFPVAAGETIMMQRGGQHVMFMGLNDAMEQDDMVTVTLTFEKAGDVVVEVPVDLERKPMHGGMQMNPGTMKKDGDS